MAKEKLKELKARLKTWSKNNVGNVGKQVADLQEELARWDLKGETTILTLEEMAQRKTCVVELFRLSKLKSSMLWQKAILQWLKEGDANSSYFHSWVNRRRRNNEILCLSIGEREAVEVGDIRSVVKEQFRSHFSKKMTARPLLENLHFQALGQTENDLLLSPFTKEEIREVVWICDSSKSPGPDGFNFYFIKEF